MNRPSFGSRLDRICADLRALGHDAWLRGRYVADTPVMPGQADEDLLLLARRADSLAADFRRLHDLILTERAAGLALTAAE